MKKTLIAMAVLAVSGASFAQTNVAITGNLIMGYKQTSSGATNAITLPNGTVLVKAVGNSDAAGFGVDTSEIYFTASEDLGGGQKVVAKMALGGADRGGYITGGGVQGLDATLTYTNNSIGQFELGATRGSAVHSGIPSAGAPVINMDGKLFQLRSSSDYLSYTAPIGPVIFQYKYSETGNDEAKKTAGGLGLGVGTSGIPTNNGQRTNDFAVVYSGGPLKLVGAYRAYDHRDDKSLYGSAGLTKDTAYVFQAGYDIGVANLGFGYNLTTASLGPKVADLMLGVNVPMGALTVGMTLGRSTASGVADTPISVFAPSAAAGTFAKSILQKADGTADGMSIGAKYDLSKRTNLTVNYASWTRSGYAQFEAYSSTGSLGEFGYTDKQSEANILLSHSF